MPMWLRHWIGIWGIQVQLLLLPQTFCVTLGKSLRYFSQYFKVQVTWGISLLQRKIHETESQSLGQWTRSWAKNSVYMFGFRGWAQETQNIYTVIFSPTRPSQWTQAMKLSAQVFLCSTDPFSKILQESPGMFTLQELQQHICSTAATPLECYWIHTYQSNRKETSPMKNKSTPSRH